MSYVACSVVTRTSRRLSRSGDSPCQMPDRPTYGHFWSVHWPLRIEARGMLESLFPSTHTPNRYPLSPHLFAQLITSLNQSKLGECWRAYNQKSLPPPPPPPLSSSLCTAHMQRKQLGSDRPQSIYQDGQTEDNWPRDKRKTERNGVCIGGRGEQGGGGGRGQSTQTQSLAGWQLFGFHWFSTSPTELAEVAIDPDNLLLKGVPRGGLPSPSWGEDAVVYVKDI